MKKIAIACFKPNPHMESKLIELILMHGSALRRSGYVSETPSYRAKSSDGKIIEVFEWISNEAKEKAHQDPEIKSIWDEFESICEITILGSLPESKHKFANFNSLF